MWNIEKWKMKNSCLISKQNAAILPNETLNAAIDAERTFKCK